MKYSFLFWVTTVILFFFLTYIGQYDALSPVVGNILLLDIFLGSVSFIIFCLHIEKKSRPLSFLTFLGIPSLLLATLILIGAIENDESVVLSSQTANYETPTSTPAPVQLFDYSESPSRLEFNGYTCISDCSGHEAGYEWAEEKGITDPDDCGGNSDSFIEGCQSYAEEMQEEEGYYDYNDEWY